MNCMSDLLKSTIRQKKFSSMEYLLVLSLLAGLVSMATSQVCSPPGQLCAKTTDCCRGCCEQYTCMERPFSCSPDLIALANSNSCQNYFCPPNQICYLREVCSPESPCPPKPFCRSVQLYNASVSTNYTKNGGRENQGGCSGMILVAIATLVFGIRGVLPASIVVQ